MNVSEVRAIFNAIYNKQANFITPIILRYGKLSYDFLFELSMSPEEDLYGVTIIQLNDYKQPIPRHDISTSFSSKEEAIKFISEFKQGDYEKWENIDE